MCMRKYCDGEHIYLNFYGFTCFQCPSTHSGYWNAPLVCALLAPEQFGQISFSIQELPTIGLSSEYEHYSFKNRGL
jgi:hypothetical protein